MDEVENYKKVKEDTIKSLREDYKYSIAKFDDLSILLSGGALGVSLSFVKDIVPLDEAIAIWMFYVAIILFVATIVTAFLAHILGAYMNMNVMDKISLDKPIDLKHLKTPYRINLAIAIMLSVGLLALVSFCISNISYLRQ